MKYIYSQLLIIQTFDKLILLGIRSKRSVS